MRYVESIDAGDTAEAVIQTQRVLLSARVGGFGVGLFLVLFFGAIFGVACLLASKTKYAVTTYVASGATYGLLLLILLVTPRGPYPEYKYVDELDWSVLWLTGMVILMLVGVCCSLSYVMQFVVQNQVRARRLNEYQDILRIQ